MAIVLKRTFVFALTLLVSLGLLILRDKLQTDILNLNFDNSLGVQTVIDSMPYFVGILCLCGLAWMIAIKE